jgi:antirestriction protein ArdC
MPSQTEIQSQITARILEGLKNGVVAWRKPWRLDPNSGSPTNVISKRPYSGINPILLDLVAMERGYTSRHWGTYQQWASLGAQVQKRPDNVKPGQWGTQVVFYKQIKKKRLNDQGDEKTETFPVLRTFTVFNIDQVDGDSIDHLRASQVASISQFDADFGPAKEAIDATGAELRHGGDRAFYLPSEDYIQMPHLKQFNSFNEYFCTAFHELTHWSESRLGWKGSYAQGELIAEISSCFCCSQVGIGVGEDITNQISYLDSWLQAMESDPKAILKAASQASKATQFILSFSRTEQSQPDDLQEA